MSNSAVMSNSLESLRNLSSDDCELIGKRHQQLESFVTDLRDTCSNLGNEFDCTACSTAKLASCRGRFPSFLYRLLETTGTHYHDEESIMLSRSHVTEKYEYFCTHHQSSSYDIIEELRLIVVECASVNQQGLPVDGYRQLYKKVSTLFKEEND